MFKKIKSMWGLDLRSLALFRIAAAICIIGDFRMRSSDIAAHYTDFGVLPRGVFLESFSGPWTVSLHLMNGRWEFQAFLFALSFIFATMLLVGYHTRLATFFSWLLLTSVQLRNPMVIQGGDVLFRMILFWSLFLPLGACYSVDSAMNSDPPPKDKAILSVATAAFILQNAFLYWFTAAVKMSGVSKAIWWDQGIAVYNALSIDQFTKPLGHSLLVFPALLKSLNYATLLYEMGGAFLFFMPVFTEFFKILGVFGFIFMHISFALCMVIGPFSWIGSMAVLPILPGIFWGKLSAMLLGEPVQIYYDGDCGFCKKTVLFLKTFCFLPDTSIHKAQDVAAIEAQMRKENSWVVLDSRKIPHYKFDAVLTVLRRVIPFRPITWVLALPPLTSLGTLLYEIVSGNRPFFSNAFSGLYFKPVKTRLSFLGNVLAALALVFVFFWNLGSVKHKYAVPPRWQPWGLVLGLDQYWNMFSPPLLDDGWYIIPGKLRDGTEVDLFKNGAPVDWSKPEYVYRTYKNTRWRKYMMNIWMDSNKGHRLHYGRYLCRDWNSRHPQDKLLDEFEIVFMRELTQPYMSSAPQKVSFWKHYCFNLPNPAPAGAPKS